MYVFIYLSGNRVGAKGVVAVAQCVLARGTMAPTVQSCSRLYTWWKYSTIDCFLLAELTCTLLWRWDTVFLGAYARRRWCCQKLFGLCKTETPITNVTCNITLLRSDVEERYLGHALMNLPAKQRSARPISWWQDMIFYIIAGKKSCGLMNGTCTTPPPPSRRPWSWRNKQLIVGENVQNF